MGIFGNSKKEEEQEPTPEVETEGQNEGVQTYMMDPSLQETHDLMQAVLAEAEQVVMGKRPILDLTAVGILAGGNILFEDNPGLAKTLLANTFAQALGIDFKRVQFTPDLLPADITGIYIWNQKDQKFEFRKGQLFCNLLLADEINRAPPKTQAALLEANEDWNGIQPKEPLIRLRVNRAFKDGEGAFEAFNLFRFGEQFRGEF